MKTKIVVLLLSGVFLIMGLIAENKLAVIDKIKAVINSNQSDKKPIKTSVEPAKMLELIINDVEYQQIIEQAINALKGNKNFKYVNALLLSDGDSISIKLRLKGDRSIHFNDISKLSFRVKLKGEERIFGVKKFSLHHPGTRNYIYEWIFHKALESVGLINLKYKFLGLTINGQKMGVYAFEEHFEKSLIENKNLPLGPILRFNEDYSWYNLHTTYVEPYQASFWFKKDSALTQQAIIKIEKWRRGKLKISDVFDEDKLASYFALTDVLWMHHAQAWKSIRFYYNPKTTLVEPIGYDGHYNDFFVRNKISIQLSSTLPIRSVKKNYWVEYYRDWYGLLFNRKESFDESFYVAYIQALRNYSSSVWLDGFFAKIDKDLTCNLELINSNHSSYKDLMFSYGKERFEFSKKAFYDRGKEVLKIINNNDEFIRAYPIKNTNGLYDFEIENFGLLAVKVDSVKLNSNKSFNLVTDNYFVLPHENNFQPRFDTISLNVPKEKLGGSEIYYRILGDSTTKIINPKGWLRK